MVANVPAEFIAFAQELADAAAAAIRPYFRTSFDVLNKADASPVTVADREAERVMRGMIEARYPQHGIYGEEFGAIRTDADWVWVLDPVDGTRSFVAGLPIFATLIGLRHKNKSVLGVIDQPIICERWWGAYGAGAYFQGAPIHTRACSDIEAATLFSTSTEFMNPSETAAMNAVRADCNIVRLSGDGYAFGLLAAGFADIGVEAEVQLYDYAALVPIIEEAGGIITDWEGRALDMRSPSRILAAGDRDLHAHVCARLSHQ